MHSRRREDVRRLFECWCEVEPGTPDRPAWVSRKFPETYKDDELQSVPKFAFPCEMEVTAIQHFSFVLTRLDGKWTYGFCRHDPQQTTAIVVLSFLPWHDIFFKFLNCIAYANAKSNLKEFLSAAYNQPVPDPDQLYELQYEKSTNQFAFQAPNPYELPKIPENRNLTEYYSAVDSECMLHVLAAMLTERRIIFSSKRVSRLSSCVQAANSLIYPMVWQQLFIPVLPLQLIDYLQAPMPFLIGVPEAVLKTVRTSDLGEVVILNIDDNTVKTPFDDLSQMPYDVVDQLKKSLKNRPSLLGDGVSRAFLRTIVQLTKGYRDALEFREKITFNGDMFVESRPTSYKPFIRSMLRLQTFQQFIEDRLYMLNSGTTFSDEFEKELAMSSEHSTNRFKQQYKDWTRQMKKEGSAFLRTVKHKANPAVKSAVKSVREGGKGVRSAYKGLRSRFRDNVTSTDGGMTVYNVPRNGLRSAPESPSSSRRPKTYAVPSRTYRKENSAYNLKQNYSEFEVSPQSPQNIANPPVDLDLMKELQNHSLFQNFPVVDRSLKPSSSRQLEAHHTLPREGAPFPDFPDFPSDVPIGTLCVFDTPPSSNRSSIDSIQFHSIRDSSSYSSCNPGDSLFNDDKDISLSKLNISSFNLNNDGKSNDNKSPHVSTPIGKEMSLARPNVSTPNVKECKEMSLARPNMSTPNVKEMSVARPNLNSFPQLNRFPDPPLVPPRPHALVYSGKASKDFAGKRKNYTNMLKEPSGIGGDLIRLDSTPDLEDFDPLSSKSNILSETANKGSLSNPLYTFHVPPNGALLTTENGGVKTSQSASNIPNGYGTPLSIERQKNDQDLLQEYGLDFAIFNICNDNKAVNKNLQSNGWTTFD